MKCFFTVLIILTTLSSFGQNVLRMNEDTVDSAELKKTYDHYVGSEFSDIAHELAKRAGENSILQSYIPNEKLAEPWTHSMALTLSQAWRFHTDYAVRKEPRGRIFEVLMQVVEDDEIGAGRRIALGEIATRLHWGSYPATNDGSLPPMEDTIRRLSAIAQDQHEDAALRRAIVPILYQYGDPNAYLDLAIELTSAETSPLAIGETFRFATPVRNSDRLTPANRAKYLNHVFQLLEKIDDKRSGTGYFLAMHIGAFVGVKPVRPGQGSFAPDQRLPEYQGEHGLTEFFFQTTVDNAIKWWAENKNKYQEANKTDAGNGSKAICRASNVLRSPSPDPKR
ncbi:MAG: hypothetical protein ACKVY0_02585 [Prosthecobacter sp.]|uniref:hypothetical protein n=1 Tax=Prosthecobacter sp. TaxID=1965333 RepID=UPI003903B2EF